MPCYHSVPNVSFPILSTKPKIAIYNFSSFLFTARVKLCLLSLRKRRRLELFENKFLRKTVATESDCVTDLFPTSWKCAKTWRQMVRRLKYCLWFLSSSILSCYSELGVDVVNDCGLEALLSYRFACLFQLRLLSHFIFSAIPHVPTFRLYFL
jgi:hypothetical protein